MFLPPELLNRILGYLSDDSQSLMVMSLVSKTWAGWCQAHLFKSVHLAPPTLQGWLKNVSSEANALASHTRTLTLEEYHLIPWINPQYPRFPLSNLASFGDVRSLFLISWNALIFGDVPLGLYFGHFGKSLRVLTLRFCRFDQTVLFNLLSLLPNVEDFEIANPHARSDGPDTIPDAPEVAPSFRGTLSLVDLGPGHLILKALATLPLRFSTIRIKGCTFYEPESYQVLLSGCRKTLVSLRFEESYRDRPLPNISLASCDDLEEVHVLLSTFAELPRFLEKFLSSITSQKLRKISFTFIHFDVDGSSDREDESDYDDDDEDEGVDEDEDRTRGGNEGEDEGKSNKQSSRMAAWESWDIILSRLARQVHNAGAGEKLTLELNVHRVSSPPDLDHLLPRFLEYGSLSINCD